MSTIRDGSSDSLPDATPVVPGERLAAVIDFQAGEGTYIRGQSIHASISGFVQQIQSGGQEKSFISVVRVNQKPLIVPQQGNTVLCKVLKIKSEKFFLFIRYQK